MVSMELTPLAKVGGLADVVGALSVQLARRGHDLRIVMPLYEFIDRRAAGFEALPELPPTPIRFGPRVYSVRFQRSREVLPGVAVYGVDCASLYDGSEVYTDARGVALPDALARASLNAQAALALTTLDGWPVDVVHAHDAQGGLAVIYRRRRYGDDLPGPGRTLLTIHNLAYQEIHDVAAMAELGLPASLAVFPGPFEFHGNLSVLKAAIVDADLVNTVSPTYAREVVSVPALGNGLGGVLASRGDAFSGILNGADYERWDPARDPHLPGNYDVGDMAGKATCRNELVRELGLADDTLVVGVVSRLVQQKGIDLVLAALKKIVAADMSLVVLGSGDAVLQDGLRNAARRWPDRVSFSDRFDEPLARRIYAGSDVFLMPSAFEPCGLSQLYALRYGTPPVVHATGGLRDTVADDSASSGTGFVFWDHHGEAMLAALLRARDRWRRPETWRKLVRRGMTARFGWEHATESYEELYRRLD